MGAQDGIAGILEAWADAIGRRKPNDRPPGGGLPVVSAPAERRPGDERRGLLRRFHLGDDDAVAELPTPGDDVLPALLHPFRDQGHARHDYPLVLVPGHAAAPLCDVLAELAASMAPADARILEDNLPRLEHAVRETLDGAVPSANAAEILSRAARLTEETLQLRGESGAQFHADLEHLVAAIAPEASLLTLGEHTSRFLMLRAATTHAAAHRAALREEITGLRSRLHDLLRLDDTGSSGDRSQTLASSLGAGQAYVDPEALARVVDTGHHATPMPPDRRARVDAAIEVLDRYLSRVDDPLVVVVHHEPVADEDGRPETGWETVEATEVCRAGSACFDRVAQQYAALFAATRLAGLELEGAYDAARHDGLRESFDWRSFTETELLALPPIVVLESAEHLAGAGMTDLSRLILSGRPINVLVTVQPATNPGLAPGEDPLSGFRFELAYLGIGHRDAYVSQSSAARPDHLMAALEHSLVTMRPVLHVVASGLPLDERVSALSAWLHDGAALEGRAHPLFHYDPAAGATWARRFDFSENPQPEVDWPTYTLPCRDEAGERQDRAVAFTFADFALLESRFRHHFRVIPADFDADELTTIDAYLALPPEEARERVPYILAVDGHDQLHRLAITRRLAFACRDRLDYWRTLQELSGVRSEYVREALERQRDEMTAAFAEERDQLTAAHEQAVEGARAEAAGEAMRRLAEALVTTDISSLARDATAGSPPVTAAPTETVADTSPAPAVELEPPSAPTAESSETEAEEPWINTVLCTTCNDCLDINPRLFVYNANKQAVIGDPAAGTFDELVRAAEKCPARCIHPGTPLNPTEPNLETLIERAAPFNI